MSSPKITQVEIEAVNAVLRTPCLSIGPRIEQFEQLVANYCGTAHGVGVSSGTAGLHLAIIAAGIQPGDEVITSSFSFIASANAVVYEGGKPVFLDIDPLTGNIDPRAIEAAVTPRTRASLPVHAFGQPADMDPILDIAHQPYLFVTEDAYGATGVEYK